MRLNKLGVASIAAVLCMSGATLFFSSGNASAASTGDNEALAAAKQYLSTEPFSAGGLVAQLEFSKFTASQASYGVAHCGANWNTQAYLAAKQYLSTEAFSLSGLITQLEFSKFTVAQATYGARKAY